MWSCKVIGTLITSSWHFHFIVLVKMLEILLLKGKLLFIILIFLFVREFSSHSIDIIWWLTGDNRLTNRPILVSPVFKKMRILNLKIKHMATPDTRTPDLLIDWLFSIFALSAVFRTYKGAGFMVIHYKIQTSTSDNAEATHTFLLNF